MLSADTCPDAERDRRAPDPFAALDAQALERGLHRLMLAYQDSRSAVQACLVVRYAEALSRHPDLDAGDDQRCRYRRLAGQWRWLAAHVRPDAGASGPAGSFAHAAAVSR